MLTLNYILLLLVTYLGLAAGTIVSYFSKEELKTGREYFLIARPVVLSIAFFYFLMFLGINFAISIPLAGILGVLYYAWDVKLKLKFNNVFVYILLAIILYETMDVVAASMIFIFGLLTASLHYDIKKKFLYNLVFSLRENLIYFLTGLVIAFI